MAGCIYYWGFSLTGVSDGTHTYYATATDTAGNVSDPSNPVTVVVDADTTPPDTSITSGPKAATNDTTPTFTFSGTDDVSPKANLLYSYKVDSAEWSAYSSETSVTLGDTSGLSDGSYTFYVKAKDEAGNEDGSPAQQSFRVDTAPPTGTVTINDGANSTSRLSVKLTLNASDPSPGSGVAQMRISNTQDGLTSARWESYSTQKSWRLSDGSGTKTVYVQYKDAATNVSAVAQDTIIYKR
jgi:Bacterial Ig-like domain